MGSHFLCAKSELPGLVAQAEKAAAKLLAEMGSFFTGAIRIEIRPKFYPMGWTVGGVLLVCDEIVREYECIDLLFYDLNRLILDRLLMLRAAQEG